MYNTSEILKRIKKYSGDFISGNHNLKKQLSSAKNYVSSMDLKSWTYGKTIYYDFDFAAGGTAKDRLYRAGFIDVMILPDGIFKKQVISAFMNWAMKVKGFDVASKFERDQGESKRFELLVHESLIPSTYEKQLAIERKKRNVIVDQVLAKVTKPKLKKLTQDDLETERREGFKEEIVREVTYRDRKVVELAKRLNGTTCTVCQFNFEKEFGTHGKGFIEMHHLHSLAHGERITTVHDLIPVCPNCHRMLHRGTEILTVERLKEIKKRAKARNMK